MYGHGHNQISNSYCVHGNCGELPCSMSSLQYAWKLYSLFPRRRTMNILKMLQYLNARAFIFAIESTFSNQLQTIPIHEYASFSLFSYIFFLSIVSIGFAFGVSLMCAHCLFRASQLSVSLCKFRCVKILNYKCIIRQRLYCSPLFVETVSTTIPTYICCLCLILLPHTSITAAHTYTTTTTYTSTSFELLN